MINYKEITKSLLLTAFILSITALLFLGIYKLKTIVAYLLISAIVALVSRPLYRILFKLSKSSALSAIITLILLLFLSVSFVSLTIPLIKQQADNLSLLDTQNIQAQFNQQVAEINTYLLNQNIGILDDFLKSKSDFGLKVEQIPKYLNKVLETFTTYAIHGFSILFISFFFIKDSDLIPRFIESVVPDRREKKYIKVLSSIENLLSRYFIGLFFQVVIMFILYFIILLVFDIQDKVIIAMICAFFNIIPYVGPLIGLFLITFLSMSSMFAAGMDFESQIITNSFFVIACYFVAQLVDNFINQPLIYAKSVKSHPLEIFLTILCFGLLFGLVGIIVAVPCYTVIKVIAKEFFSEFKLVKSITKNL